MFNLLKFLTESLIHSPAESELSALRKSIDALRATLETYRKQREAESKLPPPVLHAELTLPQPILVKTEKKKTNAIKILTLVFSVIYTLTTVFIFWQSKRSADAAKAAAGIATRQLQLTSQQLEYTYSAKLKLAIDVGFPQDPGPNLNMTFSNIGHETASNVVACFEITRRVVDSERVIGSQTVEIVAPYDLQSAEESNMGSYRDNSFPYQQMLTISPQQIENMLQVKMFIEVSGDVAYFNGFRNVVEPFCFRHARYGKAGDKPEGQMVPCSTFPKELADMK